jgi:hypothetical protein
MTELKMCDAVARLLAQDSQRKPRSDVDALRAKLRAV